MNRFTEPPRTFRAKPSPSDGDCAARARDKQTTRVGPMMSRRGPRASRARARPGSVFPGADDSALRTDVPQCKWRGKKRAENQPGPKTKKTPHAEFLLFPKGRTFRLPPENDEPRVGRPAPRCTMRSRRSQDGIGGGVNRPHRASRFEPSASRAQRELSAVFFPKCFFFLRLRPC